MTEENNENTSLIQVTLEEKQFELAQRKAAIYAKSSLVPKDYQNNIGNVLIAENMAHRMGADTLMVMQNLYIVHGKPGWSAQFLIGCFNSNGRFSAIKYRFSGEVHTNNWGCQAYCTEIATGEEISGTTITWEMAMSEGWVNKQGSKWKTMPEQMFRYRAATFLIRATAPEIGLGLLTKEELEDMPATNGEAGESRPGVAGVRQRLKQSTEQPQDDADNQVDGEIIEAETISTDAQTETETEDIPNPPTVGDDIEIEAAEVINTDESQMIDLVTAAREKYHELDSAGRKKLDRWLGQRTIKDLSKEELTEFLDI